MILVKKGVREELEEAKLIYCAVPDNENRDNLIAVLRVAFGDCKKSPEVQEVLELMAHLSEVETFREELKSGKRQWRNLAKGEIPSINSIEDLVSYEKSGDPQVVKMAKQRKFELKSRMKN